MSGSTGAKVSGSQPDSPPPGTPTGPASAAENLSPLNSILGRGLGMLLLSPDLVRLGSRPAHPAPGQGSSSGRTPAGTGRLTRVALLVSGLAAAASVVYSAPGTPWQDGGASAAALQARWTAGGPDAGAAGGGHAQMAAPTHDPNAKNFGAFIQAADHTAVLDISPAKVGVNTMAITVLGTDGQPVEPARWAAEATLDGADAPAIEIPLRSFVPGMAAADSLLPIAGNWTVTITLDLPGVGSTTFTQAVPIGAEPTAES